MDDPIVPEASSSQPDSGRGPVRRKSYVKHKFSKEIEVELSQFQVCDSNGRGIVALLSTLVIVILCSYCCIRFWFLYPFSLIIIGARQRGVAELLHSASHRTLAKNYKLNQFLGKISALLVFQNLNRYFESHIMFHHLYFGNCDKDPDYKNYIEQKLFDEIPKNFSARQLGKVMLGMKIFVNAKNVTIFRLVPVQNVAKRRVRPNVRNLTLFWSVLLLMGYVINIHYYIIFFWLLPYATTFQSINLLIELAEHFPIIQLHHCELKMSRNRHSVWAERWLTGVHGDNWHLTHHLKPAIPFWHLRKAHLVMMKDTEYASANNNYGGLIIRGTNRAPSIMSTIDDELTKTQDVKNMGIES